MSAAGFELPTPSEHKFFELELKGHSENKWLINKLDILSQKSRIKVKQLAKKDKTQGKFLV